MATRTALLNGNVINRDADFSKHIEAVSEPGVISGFAVSSSSVAVGQALVKCERTNGDTIYAVVYNNSAQEISGDGDVYIEIPQELIDNGELMNEDGSEIAEIKVGTMPDKNALKLATKSGSTITDARNMIKKSGELLALINQNIEDIEDLDERVEQLEEADAIGHLEERGIVGELFSLSNKLFNQETPTLNNSTVDCNVGDTSNNTKIHIQRIGSGISSNKLKLKVKSIGSPTTGLVVEVRKGTQVTVTANTEAYRYGGDLIASGSIAYGDISGTYAEKEITLDANFGGTKGELLDIVVYQTGSIVNSTNYYCIACDSTQYSEGFNYVTYNGSTYTRSKLMPYCISDGFLQRLLAKVKTGEYTLSKNYSQNNPSGDLNPSTFAVEESGYYQIQYKLYTNDNYTYGHVITSANQGQLASQQSQPKSRQTLTRSGNLTAGDTLTFSHGGVTIIASQLIINYTVSYAPIPLVKVPLIPLEVESLGDSCNTLSYGMNPSNNIYEGGLMIGKTNSATTGSIALGNAVGYITVNLNGEVIKIPYYNE